MDNLMPLKEVAKQLNVSPITMKRMLKRGDIKGVKVGRPWKFTEKQVSDYLKKRTIA